MKTKMYLLVALLLALTVTTQAEDFWTWSAAPPGWSALTLGGGGPYNINAATFPYLQGTTNTCIYQQTPGTIPAGRLVTARIKIADFHQTWSDGGPVEFGFFTNQPTVETASNAFAYSAIALVPNYDGAAELTDGLGNSGGNVDYTLTFITTADLTNPYFVVRKNDGSDRFGVDDISISHRTPFWTWSAAPPDWSAVTLGGGGSYNLNAATFPYLQGTTNNCIYQQIPGSILRGSDVMVTIKIADFHQTWSDGGPVEFGFFASQPTEGTASNAFAYSAIATIPNYDGATALADGLGNTGGAVDHTLTFIATADLTNPYFVVRKNAGSDRFGVDDIAVSYERKAHGVILLLK